MLYKQIFGNRVRENNQIIDIESNRDESITPFYLKIASFSKENYVNLIPHNLWSREGQLLNINRQKRLLHINYVIFIKTDFWLL